VTKVEFLTNLKNASFQALKFAENYVKTELKTNYNYNVIFTKEDANPKMKLELTDYEVVELLYRNSEVPTWIDINVLKSKKDKTTFNLLCSAKYSSIKDELHCIDNGSPPFVVKSPVFPLDIEEEEKFEL